MVVGGRHQENKIAAFNWDSLRIANNARSTFGSKIEFSVLVDRVDLLPVEPNPRGSRTSSLKISNEYRPISEMRNRIHFYDSSFAEYRRE